MASDGTPNQPTVPAYMVGLVDGLALKAKPDGTITTILAGLDYFRTGNDNIMAGFSSEGPTDVKFRIKPDVVAPGVNVLSSQPAWTAATADDAVVLGVLPGHVDGDAARGGHRGTRARRTPRLDGCRRPLGDREHRRSWRPEGCGDGSDYRRQPEHRRRRSRERRERGSGRASRSTLSASATERFRPDPDRIGRTRSWSRT